MTRTLEKRVRRIIMGHLLERGKFVPYPGSVYGEAGTPDIVGCIDGHAVLVEVKRPGGKTSAIQDHRIAEWRRAGATVVVASSWKEVEAAL